VPRVEYRIALAHLTKDFIVPNFGVLFSLEDLTYTNLTPHTYIVALRQGSIGCETSSLPVIRDGHY